MSMVFCRGCAKEIHNTAVACPGCGAQQAAVQQPVPANTGTGWMDVMKKCTDFSGRARRKEYWMFFLMNILISFLLGVIGGLTGIGEMLSNLFGLAVLLPSIAVAVRRMHDTDHRGWWLLVPIVGFIFLVLDTKPGPNRFGPSPKGN